MQKIISDFFKLFPGKKTCQTFDDKGTNKKLTRIIHFDDPIPNNVFYNLIHLNNWHLSFYIYFILYIILCIMRDVCYNNIEKYILYYFLLIYIFLYFNRLIISLIYIISNKNIYVQ